MRKIFALLCLVMCLMASPVLAENTVTAPEGVVRPGRACIITFTLDQKSTVSLTVQDEEGNVLSTVLSSYEASAGSNSVWYNGTSGGQAAPMGTWRLVLTANGSSAEVPITIGAEAPYFSSVRAESSTVAPGEQVQITVVCSEAGTVSLREKETGDTLLTAEVTAGENTITWVPEDLTDGSLTLLLQLTDATGDTSGEEHLTFAVAGFTGPAPTEVPEDATLVEEEQDTDHSLVEDEMVEEATTNLLSNQSAFTPSWTSPYYGTDTTANYWTTPMDITDEAAVWAALTADITVVDIGSKSGEKVQAYLRAAPDEDAEKVGVVTCETQSVHVLENYDNGWSLVECYSSSFHDTKVEAWNCLVQGYIKTSWLKTVTPSQTLGLVIDKLTQRLYIFKDGHLYDTLLVSTGLSNSRQPYNETRSGEFITASKVGTITSDNTYGAMAIRYNSGDLIHEVLYTKMSDGGKDYTAAEAKLGQRASHGCIRVQRRTTPNGTNMTWLWKNIKNSSKVKVFIWEDWQGRQMSIPDDDTPIYYNPKGGEYYHSADHCTSAKGKTFTAATYADLSGSLSKLKRCPFCTPPLKVEEINAINEEHAAGGDHDPVLTKAREKYYTMLAGLDDYLDGYYKTN